MRLVLRLLVLLRRVMVNVTLIGLLGRGWMVVTCAMIRSIRLGMLVSTVVTCWVVYVLRLRLVVGVRRCRLVMIRALWPLFAIVLTWRLALIMILRLMLLIGYCCGIMFGRCRRVCE